MFVPPGIVIEIPHQYIERTGFGNIACRRDKLKLVIVSQGFLADSGIEPSGQQPPTLASQFLGWGVPLPNREGIPSPQMHKLVGDNVKHRFGIKFRNPRIEQEIDRVRCRCRGDPATARFVDTKREKECISVSDIMRSYLLLW